MRHVLFVVVTLTLGVSARAQDTPNPNEEVKRRSAAFVEAFNAKDAAAVARLFADDGVLMPPGNPIVKGRAGITLYYQRQFDIGLTDLRVSPGEFSAAPRDRLLVLPSTFSVTDRASGAGDTGQLSNAERGVQKPKQGKGLMVFRRSADGWEITHYIYHYD